MIEESLLKSNFIGRDGFRWWIGQVPPVEVQDKQYNDSGWGNRCKVRIMGYHPYSTGELADVDLPWAQILLPTTAGSGAANYATNVKVRPGDIVFGFFLDGDNGQIPVIVGCFGRTGQVATGQYKGPFVPFSGYTERIPPPPGTPAASVSPDQSNEQYFKSQKSPRNLDLKTVGKLNENLKGFDKEFSFYSGIKDLVIFASFEKDVGMGSILGEIGNLLGRVAGIPNLGGVLSTVSNVAGNIASGNIAGAITGGLGSIGGLVGGNVGNIIGQVGNVAGSISSGNISGAISGGLGAVGGLVGGNFGSTIGQLGNVAGNVASGNISGAISGGLGAVGGLVGGTTGNILGQVGSISTAALSGNVGGALGTFGSLVGGDVGRTLGSLGGIVGNGSVGSVLGSASSLFGGNVSSVLGSVGGASAMKLLGEINSSVAAILPMTNGIIGAMFNALFSGLIPILKEGLALLYRTVFAKVYAATPGEHAIKFAAAHAAGVLAQKSMIPFVKKLEEAISCKAASTNSRLERPIKELLIRAIRDIQNFIPCAEIQFSAALHNHIIKKIKEELASELKGVGKILSPDFDVEEFLKKDINKFTSPGGLFDCNQNKNKSKGNVKEWEIGYGPKGSVNEKQLYNDILNAMRTINGTGKDDDEFNQKFGEWPIFNNPKNVSKNGSSSGTSPGSPEGKNNSSIKARFIRRSGSYYIEITGDGSCQIEFTMDVNDSSYIAGIAASEIIVPSDKGDVSFKRKGNTTTLAFAEGSRQGQRGEGPYTLSYYQEKENITKKSKFTGGKTYGPIKIVGASSGASSTLANDKRIELRDADGNDVNIKFIMKNISGKVSSQITPSPLPECVCDEPEVCNPPEIIIYGVGEGATATPIFGNYDPETQSGSIIGARVTNPGLGYETEPNIEFFDNCGRGYGAIARGVINEFGQIDVIYMDTIGENYPMTPPEPSVITDIYIDDPGQNYESDDIEITDQFGNVYEPVLEDGSIVDVVPINIIVVNTYPILTVKSDLGFGAALRPVLGPRSLIPSVRTRKGGELKKVIDCIL